MHAFHAYLVKRIAASARVRCLEWGAPLQGGAGAAAWLAAAGDGGQLRLLQLSGPGGDAPAIAVNQLLGAHAVDVTHAAWNAPEGLLATGDASGVVAVWAWDAGVGAWGETMRNDRGEVGVGVTELRWRSDGGAVAIGYSDGVVVVGGVDGERLWHRQYAGGGVVAACWAPDGSALLLATGAEGGVGVHDTDGDRTGAVQLPALGGLAPSTPAARVAALQWHAGGAAVGALAAAPCLAIGFACGRMQLMRGACDPAPVCVDTGLGLKAARWSPDGRVLAVGGRPAGAPSGDSEVRFYARDGRSLCSLRLPGTEGGGDGVLGMAWDPTGLRLSVSRAQG